MNLNREYVYSSKHVAFLVCDYYETNQIPQELFEIKDNLALFPIVNMPLIELILTNFVNQKFKNVVLVGSNLTSVLKHLEKTDFPRLLNLRIYSSEASSLGDVFREMFQLGFEFDNILIMYANHYTNIPLYKLLKYHSTCRNNLMTVYTYAYDTNDTNAHIYAYTGNDIIYYDKITSGRIIAPEILEAVHKNKSVEVAYWHSSPTVAVVSKDVFLVYNENYDYHTLGDMLSGMLAAGIFDCKFKLMTDKDMIPQALRKPNLNPTICERHLQKKGRFGERLKDQSREKTGNSKEKPNQVIGENASTAQKHKLKEKRYYSKEIITLFDYFKFNRDVGEDPSLINIPHSTQFIKSGIHNGYKIENSVLGDDIHIGGDILDCIVWENCTVNKDCNNLILFSNNVHLNVFHLEAENEIEEVVGDEETKPEGESFFDDVNSFLHSRVTTAKVYDSDMQSVHKQVSLLRIIWNATHEEVIESFAYFLIDSVDESDLEESLSRASLFFDVFAVYITSCEDQELFVNSLYDNSSSLSSKIKASIFFNYGYLLVQSGVVKKSVVKKYSQKYEDGEF